MDKKCAAPSGNCFADFDHRFCKFLRVFSYHLLPSSRLTGSGPKRFGNSLSDSLFERLITVSLIFRRECDQSWFRPATNSNCDARTGNSPKHKPKLRRRRLSCVSHRELSTEFKFNNNYVRIYPTRHSSLLKCAQCRINARRAHDSRTNVSRKAISPRRNLDG